MFRTSFLVLSTLALMPAAAAAEEPSAQPKPVPVDRVEMKRAIEGLKHRQPRLPLPPPPAVDPSQPANPAQPADRRMVVNNGRMRATYLPKAWQTNTFQPDPAMTLDYGFKTRLFWIVSRGNNCYYCLGHQEHKLLTAGMQEDQIAALDSQWGDFPKSEQAALQLARQMTLAPQLVGDEDVERLRLHYSDKQIVEIIFSVSSNNSTNRWTDSLGIPQDRQFRDGPLQLDTPTSARFATVASKVAPLSVSPRGALPDRDAAQRRIAECRARKPRVELPDEAAARAALGGESSGSASPTWLRALAYFPQTAAGQARLQRAVAEEGRISQLLKAQIAWTSARENRAWYALAHALARLQQLGLSADQAYALDDLAGVADPGTRAALTLARKLTSTPQLIADADIAGLRKHFADAEVAEIVFVTCNANMFDRLSETLRLNLE